MTNKSQISFAQLWDEGVKFSIELEGPFFITGAYRICFFYNGCTHYAFKDRFSSISTAAQRLFEWVDQIENDYPQYKGKIVDHWLEYNYRGKN